MKKKYNYFLAWYRYYMYYSKEIFKVNTSFMIRKHIKEQFEIRLNSVNEECYSKGSCIHCGCQVPALLFSNLQCEGKEYPVLLNKRKWKRLTSYHFNIKGILWKIKNNKFVFYNKR